MPLPRVAIVGRPNVGKSSLLNRIAGRRVSIVEPTAGVTRDRVCVEVSHGGRSFEVVDTGGLGLLDDVRLKDQVEAQIARALEEASVVVFLVDGKAGLVPGDREVADRLRRLERPVVLAANKVEARADEFSAQEAVVLGFGEVMPVSAQEGFGVQDLLDRVVELLPPAAAEEEGEEEDDEAAAPASALRIAVVGKRNAGKSTLVNAWAGEERVIVSEIPGTTRDAVDVAFRRGGHAYVAVDTAGLRKAGSVEDAVEFFSLARARAAVRHCDAVLHLFEVSQAISDVDRKLAALVVESGKPCLLAGNKMDLAMDTDPEHWAAYIRRQLKGLGFAPVLFLSARDGLHLGETLDLLRELAAQARVQVPTAELNRVLDLARARHSPRSRGRLPRVYYATQVGVAPPTVLVFVNDPALFHGDFDRFLRNLLRRELPWPEVPIRVLYRRRQREEARR